MILRAVFAITLLFTIVACRAAPDGGGATPQPGGSVTVTAQSTPAEAASTVATEPSPTVATEPTDAATPLAAEPVVPPTPESLSEAGAWLNDAVENGFSLEEARQALLDSGWIEAEEDLREIPMRAEGEALWLARIVRPVGAGEAPLSAQLPGAVFLADPAAGALVYEQFGQAATGADETFYPAPTVLTDTDFTGDQVLDLLFKLTNCGASTCYDEYHIVSYHESESPLEVIRATGFTAEGQLSDDLPFATMSFSEAYLGDQNSDSIQDLFLVGGTQGSAGAGPQRARFETYAWDGEAVVLIQTEYDESPLRYFKLVDANAAFAEADYETARTLYDEVLSNEALEGSGYFDDEAERAAMERYAQYRLVLLDILVEDYIGAQRRAEEMVEAAPDDPIATGALETVLTFARSNSLTDACAAFTASVEGLDPDPLAPLDDMGYGNTELGAETLCPL